MRISSKNVFILISSITILYLSPAPLAATYQLTFYEQTSGGNNIFDNYILAGRGTFAVADNSVRPNNLVLFSDPEFLAFDVTMDTSVDGPTRHVLGIDDFPGRDVNDGRETELGIRFDSNAQPWRFDNPGSSLENVPICRPDCSTASISRTNLALQAADSFNLAYQADGTISSIPILLRDFPDQPFNRLSGRWVHFVGNRIGGAFIQVGGVYEISAVPLPGAVWLFCSALAVTVGLSRRKKSI